MKMELTKESTLSTEENVIMLSKCSLIVLPVICAAALLPATGLADDIVWNGDGNGIDWNDEENWDEDRRPEAGDDVTISVGFPGELDVVIREFGELDDAACETLDVDDGVTLLIKAVKLTLGSATADTTSDIDGVLTFEQVGFQRGTLEIHKWVTFPGDGEISARQLTMGGVIRGQITRAGSDGRGIKLEGDFDMIGTIDVLVSLDHQGDLVGVFSDKDVMRFGNDDAYSPELQISGAILNDETITASEGIVEFRLVKHMSTAPSWLVEGHILHNHTGTIVVSNIVNGNGLPNNILMDRSSLLDVRVDMSSTGKLTFEKNCTIRVAAGKTVTFE